MKFSILCHFGDSNTIYQTTITIYRKTFDKDVCLDFGKKWKRLSNYQLFDMVLMRRRKFNAKFLGLNILLEISNLIFEKKNRRFYRWAVCDHDLEERNGKRLSCFCDPHALDFCRTITYKKTQAIRKPATPKIPM